MNDRSIVLPVSIYFRIRVEAFLPHAARQAIEKPSRHIEASLKAWSDNLYLMVASSLCEEEWHCDIVSAKPVSRHRVVCDLDVVRLSYLGLVVKGGSAKSLPSLLSLKSGKPALSSVVEVAKCALEELYAVDLFSLFPCSFQLQGIVSRQFVFQQRHQIVLSLNIDNSGILERLDGEHDPGALQEVLNQIGSESLEVFGLEESGFHLDAFYSDDEKVRRNGKYKFEGSLTSQFSCGEDEMFGQGIPLSASINVDDFDGWGEACEKDIEYVKAAVEEILGDALVSYAVHDDEELVDIDVIYSTSQSDLARISSKLKIG